MESLKILEDLTAEFLTLHWDSKKITEKCPHWATWDLDGVPEEATKGGCYAIFDEQWLLYIGLAVTEGSNQAKKGEKYGLLNRLQRHVIMKGSRTSSNYVPKNKQETMGRNKIYSSNRIPRRLPLSGRCLGSLFDSPAKPAHK